MDDESIGGGAGQAMGPSSAEQADNSGPLEKRILSKNWSVRAGAYEELTKLSEDAPKQSKADFFRAHVSEWKNYLKDSNPGALEKALNCLTAFLDKIHPSFIDEASQNGMLTLLVEKCLGHAKPVIKEKATECMLLLFEVSENFEASVETLLALTKHKNIKVMTCGTLAVAALVANFGIKKLKIQDFAEQMLKNAAATNPACKNAAYDFYKAVYKWIGEAIVPQIEDKLKKIQVDDLKKLFVEVKAKGDKTKRVVRSEKAAAEAAAKDAQIDAAMAEEAKAEPEVDPLEFAPEKDVLANFGIEWQEATAAIKKWDDKVAKFTELIEACKNVKVKAGNTDALAAFLKKEVAATNINISLGAINASTALAAGMGKGFASGIKVVVAPILLKYKEKRLICQEAVNRFCDALPKCTDLGEVREEVIPLIANVAPGVKAGVLKFVEQAIQVTYIDVLKSIGDDYMAAVKKALDDKDGGVRDTALHCIGIFKGRLEDKAVKYVKDVNAQKMAKIEEAAKEVQPTKYDRPENWVPPAPKKKAATAKEEAANDDDLMSFDTGKPKRGPPKGIGVKPKKKVQDEEINNDDELMDFDAGPPKRGPPKGIGSKPPSRKKKAEEEDESMEESKAPAKKAPAAKPRAASGKPLPPMIEDGDGLSKEDAIAKVEDFFDADTVKKFEDAKWQVKLEAFSELQDQIVSKEAPYDMVEAAAKFIKARMKDWKESNINLQKAIIAFYNFIAMNCEQINKRTVFCASSFFVDKIGDVKLSNLIKEMLMNIGELVTPKFICLQVIKHASTAKAPKNIQESCVIITQIMDEFGIGGCALKETIDLGKIAAAHATPAVRQAAMKMFCELFRHCGEAIKSFLTDIKESTLKMIDAELAKVTKYEKGEHEKKRLVRGAADDAPAAGGGKGKGKAAVEEDLFADLPREDISKKLTSKLMEQFKNKDWKLRKKAGDEVEAILKGAKMRIEANGLHDLMDAMKAGMKDPNKAVVKVFINLLGLLAEALGSAVRQYTKKCLVPMLNNISDKQTLVRADVVSSLNKWKDAMGAELIINQLCPVLEVENPEGRNESFKWINENIDAIPGCDTNALVKPLTLCLTDKSKAIRLLSEEVIKVVMPIVGYQSFVSATSDMKQAVKQTLKPILDKLKEECKGASAPAGRDRSKSREPVKKEESKKPPNSFAKAAVQKKGVQELDEKEKSAIIKKAPMTSRAKAAMAEEDEVVIKTLNKTKRQAVDQRNKWPLLETKGDHVERLQAQCMDCFGTKFHDQMWAKAQDFGKHIKCIDTLDRLIQTQPDEICEILDIVFKWCNVRMNESSNTKLFVRILDFYAVLLQFLIQQANPLEDFEIHVLLGTLCDKVGINNKILMEKMRKLIRMCFEVYDDKLCYRLIVDIGVKAKNLRSVAECLDVVAGFMQENGIDVVTKKDFALFTACADNSDKSVRENSLKVFAEAYIHLNEDIWRLLSKDVPIKVKGLLEGRFKQVAKKAGNNLGMSTNSQKAGGGLKNNLAMSSSGTKAVRRSVMPSPAGAGDSLKFNRLNVSKGGQLPQAEKSGSNSSQGSQKIAQEFQKLAPFSEKEPREEEMKHEEARQNLQAVFQGKQNPQEDIEMTNSDRDREDAQAVVVGAGRKNETSAAKHDQPQDEGKDVQMDDDDEITDLLRKAEQNLDIDPALRQEQQNILNHIQQLVEGDLLKRVDSLVALNEMISAAGGQASESDQLTTPLDHQNQQQALIRCCNELISAFTHVMADIFSYPVNDIPLRFTKYFITIVNKTCACKEIMKEVNEKQVYNIAQQLLTRLLIDNLDKIGQNKEGELILKNLNSAMLRMLENCNHTYIFVVLFKLLRQYKDNADMPKLAGLIIKCLLKLSKIMDRLIEKINLSKFLVAIHEYLCVIDHDNKSQNDDLGIRIVKTLVNEVVKLKKNDIWGNYKVIEQHGQPDNHIKKWIQIILRSLPGENSAQPAGAEASMEPSPGQKNLGSSEAKQTSQSRMYIEFEIKKIIQELRDPAKVELAIPKLDKFAKQNPAYNFQTNLKRESEQFCQQVLGQLESFRSGNSWKSTNEDSLGASGQDHSRTSQTDKMAQLKNKLNAVNQGRGGPAQGSLNSSINRQSEFQNKMAMLKQKQSTQIGGSQTMRGTMAAPAGQNNLNSSFSALNNSLSQKWAAINSSGNAFNRKLGTQTGRQTMQTSNLAQTMGPSAIQKANPLNTSSNKFQSKLGGIGIGGGIGQGIGQGIGLGVGPGAGFANRLQSKMPPTGQQKPSQLPPAAYSQAQLNLHAQTLNKSLNNQGGVTMNSFKSRLQGFQGGAAGTQTNVPVHKAGGASANTQDLKNRLAEMKAKLQGMNKK